MEEHAEEQPAGSDPPAEASSVPVQPGTTPIHGMAYGWVSSSDGESASRSAADSAHEVVPIYGQSYGWISASVSVTAKPQWAEITPIRGQSYGWLTYRAPADAAAQSAAAHMNSGDVPNGDIVGRVPIRGTAYGWITARWQPRSPPDPPSGSVPTYGVSYGWISLDWASAEKLANSLSDKTPAAQKQSPDSSGNCSSSSQSPTQKAANRVHDDKKAAHAAKTKAHATPQHAAREPAQPDQAVARNNNKKGEKSKTAKSSTGRKTSSPEVQLAPENAAADADGADERRLPVIRSASDRQSSGAARRTPEKHDSAADEEANRLPEVVSGKKSAVRHSKKEPRQQQQQHEEDGWIASEMAEEQQAEEAGRTVEFAAWVRKKKEEHRQRDELHKKRLRQLRAETRQRAMEVVALEEEFLSREAGWDIRVIALPTKKPIYPPVTLVVNAAAKDMAAVIVSAKSHMI